MNNNLVILSEGTQKDRHHEVKILAYSTKLLT